MARWAGNDCQDTKNDLFETLDGYIYDHNVTWLQLVRMLAELITYVTEYYLKEDKL